MIRIPWRASVTVATLVAMTGCGWLPTSGQVDGRAGFALMIQAPEAYRGNSSVSMRFNMPRKSGYSVAALASDIERIDVALLEMGSISMPAGVPMPTPASMPGIAVGEPGSHPTKPATEPWPSDLEKFPTILPDNPTEPVGKPAPPPPRPMPPDMAPPEGIPEVSILPAPMPGAKPLVSSPVVAKATISRADLDKGQGDVVFNDLKAGVYGIQIVAVGRDGLAIGKSMQSVTVQEGETAAIDSRLVLDGPSGSGGVSVGVTIVEGDSGGTSGNDVATASPVLPPVLPPPPSGPMPWPRKGG